MSGGYWVLWVVWGIFLHTIGPNKFMGVMCVGGEVGKIVFNLGMHFTMKMHVWFALNLWPLLAK